MHAWWSELRSRALRTAIEATPGTVEVLHAVRIWPSRGPCDSGPFLLGVRSGRTPSKNSPAVSRPHSGQTRTAFRNSCTSAARGHTGFTLYVDFT